MASTKKTPVLGLDTYNESPLAKQVTFEEFRLAVAGENDSNMIKIDNFANQTNVALNGKASTAVATSSNNGVMSSTDKIRMDAMWAGQAGNVDVTGHNANPDAHENSKKVRLDGIPTDVNFKGVPQYHGKGAYGLGVDLTTNTFTRLGDASGKVLSDFQSLVPFSLMQRELIEGQTMVKIPLFYYKRRVISKSAIPQSADANEIGDNLVQWEDWISMYPYDGYFVHPMFVKDGKIVPYVWFSAYEGSIYDKSEGVYLLEDEQVADFNNDLLCSIPNAKPCSGLTQNLTIENARKLANNRNVNSEYSWFQQDFNTVSGIQLLLTIAMGNYDSQATIGRGVVDLTDDGATNMAYKTGETQSMGSTCGYLGTNGKSSVNAFGIENFWGNIWKFVDGFVIEAKTKNQGWINCDSLSVNTTANKDNLGFTIAKESNYMSKIGYSDSIDYAFIPSEAKNTGAINKDYLYQNNTANSFFVALLGGRWSNGSSSGCFYWRLYSASGIRFRDIGARLVCIKK